jgi:hypothetical protein
LFRPRRVCRLVFTFAKKTFAAEERLSQLMLDHARIVLTPGESQRELNQACTASATWVTPEVLEIAMEEWSSRRKAPSDGLG